MITLTKPIQHFSGFRDTQTHTVELINRCALALPKPKPCPDERCTNNCIDSCLWNKDGNPESVTFNEIDVNENEKTALNKFGRERILVSLREAIAVCTYLKKLQTVTTADLGEVLWNENSETENSENRKHFSRNSFPGKRQSD